MSLNKLTLQQTVTSAWLYKELQMDYGWGLDNLICKKHKIDLELLWPYDPKYKGGVLAFIDTIKLAWVQLENLDYNETVCDDKKIWFIDGKLANTKYSMFSINFMKFPGGRTHLLDSSITCMIPSNRHLWPKQHTMKTMWANHMQTWWSWPPRRTHVLQLTRGAWPLGQGNWLHDPQDGIQNIAQSSTWSNWNIHCCKKHPISMWTTEWW